MGLARQGHVRGRSSKSRLRGLAPCVLGWALAVAGCAGDDPASLAGRATEDTLQLRIGIDVWPGYFPLLLAQDDPALAEAGVALRVEVPEDTDSMLTGLAVGLYDGVAVALGDLILVTQAGDHARVVAVTDVSDGGDAVVSNQPLPAPGSLRGMRLGTNLGGFGEVFVREMLARQGLSAADVVLVNVEAADVLRLLEEGRIDAGHTWQPYVGQAVRSGRHVWFSSEQTPGLIPDVLAFRTELLREHPRKARAVIDAFYRAARRWEKDRQAGNREVAQALGIAADSISLEGIRLMDREDSKAMLLGDGPAQLRHVTGRYVDFFVTRGMLRSPYTSRRMLDASLL